MSPVILLEQTAHTSALSAPVRPCLPQCPWKKLHPDIKSSTLPVSRQQPHFSSFFSFCPYRCFSVIPPSSSLKRCSPPEALPLLSTAALNAPTPVMLAPDSRSFVDNGAGRSLAVGVQSVKPLCVQGCCSPSFAIFYIYHYARADVSGKVAERGTFIRG